MARTMGMFDEAVIKRVMLDKERFRVSQRVPVQMIRDCTIERIEDELGNSFVYHLQAFLAAKSSTRTDVTSRVEATHKFPKTWWDHTKQRFAPQWFLSRWPVAYDTVEAIVHEKHVVTTTNVCPHVEVPRDGREHFEWLSFELPRSPR